MFDSMGKNANIAFSIIMALGLLVPAILGYIMQLKISVMADVAFSIYGLHSLVYFILQLIFSEINEKKVSDDIKNRQEDWSEKGVGIVVVGYNEEKDLLVRCLESIKASNYGNVRRVVFVIDGNEEKDMYMADIYKKVMNDNVVKMTTLIRDMKDFDYDILGDKNVCIMQPHGGKREGLYTGFKVLMNDPEIDVIVTTDSDTILDENSVKELAYQCRHEEVGAVAGQIGIWNTSESLLTHIVAYRYWLSFNLERACESFWGTVLCVAGPMACYKVDVLKSIMDGWYDQTFMGEKYTFGDDRHLTNRVLKEGKKVVYTSHAIGYTDTPSNWGRYFIQQTRWSKSYFREFFYNMQSVHLHPLWMTYELCYHFVYFFLLMYWSLYILYFCSIFQKSVAVLMTLGIGLIKSLYGAIKTKNAGFMYFMLYSFVYFLMIIPAKIAAIVTLWDTRWGTRGKGGGFLHSYWSVILWVSALAGGFIYTTLKNVDFNYDNDYRYKIAFVGWFAYIGFLVLSLVIEYVCRRLNLFSSELEMDIKRERKLMEFIK